MFGSTLHVMAETVDSGPIVDTGLFEVPSDIGFLAFEALTYGASASLFSRAAKALATEFKALQTVRTPWTGKRRTKRQYMAICDIPADVPAGC